MEVKLIEVRDRATFIPAMAIRLGSASYSCEATLREGYLFARAGYGPNRVSHMEYVFMVQLAGGTGMGTSDPYDWESQTMQVVHSWLINQKNWENFLSGDVIDVEFITGVTSQPKVSERNDGG